MRKYIIAAVLLLSLLFRLSCAAFALNDREYYDMKKDPFFRAADKRLSRLIEEVKALIPEDEFEALMQSHNEWLESGRDDSARELIANNNLAKVDAYVYATEGRIKYIEGIKRKYTHEPEEIKPEIKSLAQSGQENISGDKTAELKAQAQAQEAQESHESHESKKLTQVQAQELLERELKERGLWNNNSVIILDDEADSEIFTLHDYDNNTSEDCWHFVHGEDFPDYVSAINDYYVSMNDGSVYVLDTFDDVVRPIDEAEL